MLGRREHSERSHGAVQIRLTVRAVGFSKCLMLENARLSPSIGQFDVGFVEREATPWLFITLSIQLHRACLSLSITVYILDICGVDRVRSTVHNRVHTVGRQPDTGRNPVTSRLMRR